MQDENRNAKTMTAKKELKTKKGAWCGGWEEEKWSGEGEVIYELCAFLRAPVNEETRQFFS